MLAFELTSVDEGSRKASASCVGSDGLSRLFWLNATFLPTQKKSLLPKGCLVKPWLPGGENEICYSTKIDRKGAGWPEVDRSGPALHLSGSSGKTWTRR